MAKARLVKCKYCGEMLDRDTEEYVQISNRYAHKKCHEEFQAAQQAKAQEVKTKRIEQKNDITPILDFIWELCNKKNVDFGKVQLQINRYLTENMTASGILKTLNYYYIIKGNKNNIEEMGIGIVPYYYNEAKVYYAKMWKANKYNETVELENKPLTINIQKPVAQPMKKYNLFKFLDEEVVDGE